MAPLTRKRKAEVDAATEPQQLSPCKRARPSPKVRQTIRAPAIALDDETGDRGSESEAEVAVVENEVEVGMEGARRAVLYTAELLESALLWLDPCTLFAMQRVCVQFRNTIVGSPALQAAMLLRPPLVETPRLRWASESSGRHDPEPRLFEVRDDSTPSPLIEGNKIRIVTPTRLNPVLRLATGGGVHHKDCNLRIVRWKDEDVAPTRRFELRKSESWRKMLICDPPPLKAQIDLRWVIKKGVEGSVVQTVEDSKGVTIAGLLNAALCEKTDGKNGRGHWKDMESSGKLDVITLDVLLSGLEGKYGKKARLVENLPCAIKLFDMVVPLEREWEEMKRANNEVVVKVELGQGDDREQSAPQQ